MPLWWLSYTTPKMEPSSSQVKIYFSPGLSRAIGTGDDFLFHNPLIKVVAKDTQQYSIDTNNLYKYSLSLEEVQ